MPSKNILDGIPRWALVIIALYGIYLLHQREVNMESTLQMHARELQELKLVVSKLTYIIEIKERDKYGYKSERQKDTENN